MIPFICGIQKNCTNKLSYILEKFKTAGYGHSSCELHICKEVIHIDCKLNDELDLCNVEPAYISSVSMDVLMIIF